MPWEDPATAFRSAGIVIPPEIAAKKAAAAIAEAQYMADQAQVQLPYFCKLFIHYSMILRIRMACMLISPIMSSQHPTCTNSSRCLNCI